MVIEALAEKDAVTGASAKRDVLIEAQAKRDVTGAPAKRDVTGAPAKRDVTGALAKRDVLIGAQAERDARCLLRRSKLGSSNGGGNSKRNRDRWRNGELSMLDGSMKER
jgi:hypothetical protein